MNSTSEAPALPFVDLEKRTVSVGDILGHPLSKQFYEIRAAHKNFAIVSSAANSINEAVLVEHLQTLYRDEMGVMLKVRPDLAQKAQQFGSPDRFVHPERLSVLWGESEARVNEIISQVPA